jgi:adenylate cyclase
MTWRPRPVIAFGLLPTLIVATLSLYRPAQLSALERAAYDTQLRTTTAVEPSGRVIIVDVDERSLSTIGQWPWRRDLIGTLVSELRKHGAAIVALDIIFAETDRFEGVAVPPDVALAHSLREGRVVLGYGMTFVPPETPRDCLQHPIGLVVLGAEDSPNEAPLFQAAGAICSLPLLADAAGASGFLNAAPDADGLLRRAPVLMELEGRVYPSLALAAVAANTGAEQMALRVQNVNASSLLLSTSAARQSAEGGQPPETNRAVPLDGKGNLLIRYRGKKHTFPYVSAADVLTGNVLENALRDKLVIVGTTALGTREVVSTPLDTQFTGVEVQATIADNLLQQDFLRRPEHAVMIETLMTLACGLAVTLLIAWAGHIWGALSVVLGMACIWGAGVWLLTTTGAFVSPLFPTMSLAGSLAGGVVGRLTAERRRAERAGREREDSRRLMVQTLLSLTEIKDAETGRHSRRTRAYTSVLLGELANHPGFRDYLTPERVELIVSLAPLHDIGKVGVPDRVLNKPGGLTPEELAEMRKHPIHGRDVIIKAEREAGVKDDLTLAIAKDIVYTHHERWDGGGYPEGLRGQAIPIPGRVMAVVDVYDAVLTRKLYAPTLSNEEAIALIAKGRGTHFDPDVVDAFLRVVPLLEQVSRSEELNG